MKLTRRMFYVDALAFRVPYFSRPQMLECGTGSQADERNARRIVQHLEQSRLIRRLKVLARPAPEITGPLHVGHPGDAPPDFHAIQYQAEQRN